MFPEGDSVFDGGVPIGGEMLYEAVVGYAACLFETRHPFLDLDVDVAVISNIPKMMLDNNFFGDNVDEEAHIFEFIERGDVIKVFDVDASEAAIGGRDGAVEEYLDGRDGGAGQ